jgi:hypothetical protein
VDEGDIMAVRVSDILVAVAGVPVLGWERERVVAAARAAPAGAAFVMCRGPGWSKRDVAAQRKNAVDSQAEEEAFM